MTALKLYSKIKNYQLTIYQLTILIRFIIIICALGGCSDSKVNSKLIQDNDCLIRIGDNVITVADFNKAFEIVRTAYPYNLMQNPVYLKEAQLRLLNQMTDEAIILERAKELHIKIKDTEVEKFIEDIKKDYPDTVFEQMFLEHAVSYQSWKNELKKRMLVDKVIANDLQGQIEIITEDITRYYEDFMAYNIKSNFNEKPKDNNEKIIKFLRKNKAEDNYIAWIKKLKNKYVIQINKNKWKKILGS